MADEHEISPIDPRTFWRAIGNRAVGVTIVTAIGEDGPAGFLGLSASHLTASPPLVTVAIDGNTAALASVRRSGAFAINYLSATATPVYERFSARDAPTGAARFAGLDWHSGATGSPIFRDVVGAFDCRVTELIERHGVILAIGEIIAISGDPDANPLVYFRGAARPL
jgi:flavin reductase (DIM6/NTAB) family NADH-FMN oxidoreductase RutF